MNMQDLQQKAVAVLEQYHQANEAEGKKRWSTKEIALGMTGDLGDLQKMILAKEGYRDIENVDQKLSHELGDVLWSLLVLSDSYDIDLEQAFLGTIEELKSRLHQG